MRLADNVIRRMIVNGISEKMAFMVMGKGRRGEREE